MYRSDIISKAVNETNFGLICYWLQQSKEELQRTKNLHYGDGYTHSKDDIDRMIKRDKDHLRWCRNLVNKEFKYILDKLNGD